MSSDNYVALVITSCRMCPYKRVEHMPGHDADNWFCYRGSKPREIAGYIEYASEEPRDIYRGCPLKRTAATKLLRKLRTKRS